MSGLGVSLEVDIISPWSLRAILDFLVLPSSKFMHIYVPLSCCSSMINAGKVHLSDTHRFFFLQLSFEILIYSSLCHVKVDCGSCPLCQQLFRPKSLKATTYHSFSMICGCDIWANLLQYVRSLRRLNLGVQISILFYQEDLRCCILVSKLYLWGWNICNNVAV